MRLIRDSGTVSIGPNLAKSTAGIAGRAPPAAGAPPDAAARQRSLHVLPGDAALLSGAFERVEVKIELARKATNRRAGEDAGEVGLGESRRPGRERRRQIPRRDRRGFGRFGGVLLFLRFGFILLRRCDRRGRSAGVELRDQGAHRHFVADLGDELDDLPGRRRRHVHRRLVGFERHQRLFGLDRVACLHQDFDDRHVLEVADIRDRDVDRRGLGRGRRGGGLGGRRRSGLGGRRGARGLASASVDARDQRPHRDFVADLRHDLGDRAGDRRRHVHRRLVGLERHQRLLGLHDVARFDQDLDHRNILEVADIGNVHVDFRHRRSPQADKG